MSDEDIEFEEGEENSSPEIEFEWSDEKAEANLQKHDVAFEEASTAFNDDFAYIQEDELHSEDEPREWLIGYSDRDRLLMISFLQRAHDKVRIISARLVTRRERKIYEERSRF